MRCAVCEKESNNKRVCPYCFTPYPREDGGQARQSASMRQSQTSLRQSGSTKHPAPTGNPFVDQLKSYYESLHSLVMRQTAVVRWTGAGIIIVVLIWAFSGDEEATFEAGSVPSTIIASPMQREDALALMKRTRETALVDETNDELFVSYPAASFPLKEEGQIALAQQLARADEIITGRKRRIFFYNPNGKVFAQSDGVTGVTVVK